MTRPSTSGRPPSSPVIRDTVRAHSHDLPYLEGPHHVQVYGELRQVYTDRARFEELADAKYTEPGGIFDCMAITVIQTVQVA